MTLKEAGVLRVGDKVILKNYPELIFTIAKITLFAPRPLGDYYSFWIDYDGENAKVPTMASHVDILRRV